MTWLLRKPSDPTGSLAFQGSASRSRVPNRKFRGMKAKLSLRALSRSFVDWFGCQQLLGIQRRGGRRRGQRGRRRVPGGGARRRWDDASHRRRDRSGAKQPDAAPRAAPPGAARRLLGAALRRRHCRPPPARTQPEHARAVLIVRRRGCDRQFQPNLIMVEDRSAMQSSRPGEGPPPLLLLLPPPPPTRTNTRRDSARVGVCLCSSEGKLGDKGV